MLNIGTPEAFFIVAGLASLVVVPWLVWNLIGALVRRPRVRLQFDRRDGRDGTIVLGCEIINDPIYFNPLTALGIKRHGFDEVYCTYTVFSTTTEEPVLSENAAALHDHKGGHHDSAPLPTGFRGLYFAVATWEGGTVAIVRDSAGAAQIVAPDTYKCLMFVHADELHIGLYARDFTVGVAEEHFQWVGRMKRIRPRLEKIRKRFR